MTTISLRADSNAPDIFLHNRVCPLTRDISYIYILKSLPTSTWKGNHGQIDYLKKLERQLESFSLARSDKLGAVFTCPKTHFTCPGQSDNVNVEPCIMPSFTSCLRYDMKEVKICLLSKWYLQQQVVRSFRRGKTIYDFWCLPENSQQTGNKKDVRRIRVGPKTYCSYELLILEKTQSEVFLSFQQSHPGGGSLHGCCYDINYFSGFVISFTFFATYDRS
jgi:hypothetical protein